ncbi:MAG: LCP family protein [Butyrivibrio sp.]|nr:LCP family protein [Butyrivibrio sp.]
MSNRDDEFYERGERRPARRDDRRRDDRRRDDRYDDYDDYNDRPARMSSSGGRSSASKSGSSKGNAPRRSGSRKKKNNTKALVLLIVEILVAVGLLFAAYMVFFRVDVTKVGKVDMNEEKINSSINEGVADNQQMLGYTNLALFGVDTRDEAKNQGAIKKNTRSDTIIIASINNDTGDIKLCSVYRDTYLNLSNDKYTKCNAAYGEGGPEQAISMLNMNLDMDIKGFVTVGFKGLTDVVNALGGVTIDVTDAEIPHLNSYQSTMATELGMDYTPVTSAGVQTLNGLQATAYCRIRYTAGDDFKRAERQRTVLMACIEKAQGMNYSQLEKIANAAFEETYTSLDLSEILDLLKNITKYKVVDNNGFPEESMRTTGTIGKKGSCVIPTDLASNVKWLHQFLFEDDTYEVSSDVQKYSDKIKADTDPYLK